MSDPTEADREAGSLAVHVVCADPEAHRQLLELCASWHRRTPNSLYVDWEQSLLSYLSSREDNSRREALARREGREAGLAQAAERVRAQARRFDPIAWGRLADEIAALPPPGEGG